MRRPDGGGSLLVEGGPRPVAADGWVARWGEACPSGAATTLGAPDRSGRALRWVGEPDAGTPRHAGDATCGVVFDGVLHERDELARQLGADDGPAIGDAGLVLKAYRRWGDGLLGRVKGLFALVV